MKRLHLFLLLCAALFSCTHHPKPDVINQLLSTNDSLLLQCNTLQTQTQQMFSRFGISKTTHPIRASLCKIKADSANLLTNQMIEYIDQVIAVAIAKVESMPVEQAKSANLHTIKGLANNNISTQYLFGTTPDGSNGEGHQLKIKLEQYKNQMLCFKLPTENDTTINTPALDTQGPFYDAGDNLQSFEQHLFFESVLIADIVLLNTIKYHILKVEHTVVSRLLEN